MSSPLFGKDKSSGMNAPMVQGNKNVQKAVQNPDQHTLHHQKDVPEVVNGHFEIRIKSTNYNYYQEKQPKGLCVILPTDDPDVCHASIQTDPMDVDFEEYERLRKQQSMLIEKGRQQEIQQQQYKHVAEQSVSQQYLDNACALTPSHAVVDSAISIVRETTAQELLKKADIKSLQKLLNTKADKETVVDATLRVDKQQKFANGIILDIEEERRKRQEDMRLNEQLRQEEVARAEAALQASENRILSKQKNQHDLLDEFADEPSSDDDLHQYDMGDKQSSRGSTVQLSSCGSTLDRNSGSYQLNLYSKKVKKSKGQRPYDGVGVDEALKERVKQQETALSLWENAENSDRLLEIIERHMQMSIDQSVGARLKNALQQCVVNADQQRKACAILDDKFTSLDSNAGDDLVQKQTKQLRDVESKLTNDDSSIRGQHYKQSKQHAEVNEAMKQIRELFANRQKQSTTNYANPNTNSQNNGHTDVIYRTKTGSSAQNPRTDNLQARMKRLHSQNDPNARTPQNDAHRKVVDRVAEVSNIVHLLNARQTAFRTKTTDAFHILDQAVKSQHEAIDRNNVQTKHSKVLLEKEKSLVKKAVHAESVVYSLLTTHNRPY